jgi:hypothetical protein
VFFENPLSFFRDAAISMSTFEFSFLHLKCWQPIACKLGSLKRTLQSRKTLRSAKNTKKHEKSSKKCTNARQNTEIQEALEKDPVSTLQTRFGNSQQFFCRHQKSFQFEHFWVSRFALGMLEISSSQRVPFEPVLFTSFGNSQQNFCRHAKKFQI